MTKAECTPAWCSEYCQVKSNGRQFESKCDTPLSCVCEFARQPVAAGSGNAGMMTRKAECTQEFCSNFCESKSNGRKFEAKCDESGACTCKFPWRKTMSSFMPSPGPSEGSK